MIEAQFSVCYFLCIKSVSVSNCPHNRFYCIMKSKYCGEISIIKKEHLKYFGDNKLSKVNLYRTFQNICNSVI